MRRILREHLMLAAALALLCTGAVTFIALVPSYVTARYNARSVLTSDAAASSATSSTMIAETRDLITIARQAATSSSAIDAIRFALSLRPAGVAIDTIGYIKSTSVSQIELDGSAQHASDIEAYRSALAGSGNFTQVSVPVGSLAGTTNGKFSITLTGAF